MKSIITICFNSKLKNNKYDLNFDISYDCNFEIETNIKNPFSKIYTDDDNIRKNLKKTLDLYELDMYSKTVNLMKQYLNGELNLFSNLQYIQIDATYDKIIEYIERNPELKDKKIVLCNVFKLDDASFQELNEKFSNYPNIYVIVEGNKSPITIKDFEKTLLKINEIVQKIKRYDYSPLEQLMYAYDLIRDRIYLEEDVSEESTVSRDLSSVLFGDKIVCAGYANIFNAVVNKLGISVTNYFLDCNGLDSGHQRNISYVKDDKYGVEGIYYFDLTADRKRKNQDNSFLNTYRCFCKTRKEIESYFPGLYTDETLLMLTEDIVTNFEEKYSSDKVIDVSSEFMRTMNNISRLVDNDAAIKIYPMSLSDEEVKSRAIRYNELFNNSLSANIFLKVFYNVRKNEYYEEPEKYPFSIDDFKKTLLRSGFSFNCSKEEAVLLRILSNKEVTPVMLAKHKLDTIVKESKLDRNIQGVRLAKSLRNISFKNNQIN